MIELLRGTSEHLAKEAKDEIKKKVRAVTATVGQTVEKATKGKASKKDKEDEEEFEYVLMKRKKVEDKTKSKKKAEKAEKAEKASKEVKEATAVPTPVVEGEAAAPAEADKDKKGRNKTFYKRGVFQSLRAAADAEIRAKQQEEEEKANARSGGRKKEGAAAEEPAEPAKEDKKDKPAKPKKANAEGAETAEVNDNQAVGPRQPQKPRREPRETREPKEPREAPPPPPRPLGGSFETASLDDMLSAISTHYGPKPKQNFARLPAPVLLRLFKMLSVRDIIALSRVNYFLSKQIRDDKLWKNLCEKDFAIKIKNTNSKKKFKNIYRDEYLKSKGKAPAK